MNSWVRILWLKISPPKDALCITWTRHAKFCVNITFLEVPRCIFSEHLHKRMHFQTSHAHLLVHDTFHMHDKGTRKWTCEKEALCERLYYNLHWIWHDLRNTMLVWTEPISWDRIYWKLQPFTHRNRILATEHSFRTGLYHYDLLLGQLLFLNKIITYYITTVGLLSLGHLSFLIRIVSISGLVLHCTRTFASLN